MSSVASLALGSSRCSTVLAVANVRLGERAVWSRFLHIRFFAAFTQGTGGPPSALPAFDRPMPARLITGWEAVEEYPDRNEWFDLGVELNDEQADALADHLGGTSRQNDKLLGWPSWPQYPRYPKCRVCGRELWVIFSLESDQNLSYMFGDDGCGHISGCPVHPDELAFAWQSY